MSAPGPRLSPARLAWRHARAYLLACLIASVMLLSLFVPPWEIASALGSAEVIAELGYILALTGFWVVATSPWIAVPAIWWMRRTGCDRLVFVLPFGALTGAVPMLLLTGFEPGYGPLPYVGTIATMAAGVAGAFTYWISAPARTARP